MRSPEFCGSESPRDGYSDFPLDDEDFPLDEEKSFDEPVRHSPVIPVASSPLRFPPAAAPSHPTLLSSSPHSQHPAFTCSLSSVSILLDLLSSLQIQKPSASTSSTPPLLLHTSIQPSGLKFTVNRSKTLSARAYVKANLFSEWRLRDEGEQLGFTVSLARFVHVLSVFGGIGCLVLTMEDGGEAVKMEMESDGALCDCSLACVVGTGEEDDGALNFQEHRIVARGALQSSTLRAAFSDLDLIGASHFTLLLSPSIPHMRLATQTEGISVLASLASSAPQLTLQQSNPFTDFELSSPAPLRLVYPAYLIAPTVSVLGLSEHTNLRVNEAGMLSMQHVFTTRMADVSNWVEFVCAASEGEGEAEGANKWGKRLFSELVDLD